MRGLVQQLLQRVGEGDTEAAAALFSKRVDFEIPHDDAVWWIPRVETRAEFAHFLTLLGSELTTESFEVDHVIVDGDDAVVLGRMTESVRRTGKRFTSRFSLHLAQENGFLTRYHFLEDSAAVSAAARG